MKSVSIFRWGALLVALIASYQFAIVRSYFPIVEGWWNIYPWAVDHGRTLYKDLFLVFPPLHYLFVRVVWDGYGDSFLAMRIAGVLAHVIEVLFVYLFLCRLYSPRSALCGALLSALWLLTSNGAYVAGDYHPTVGLFVAASLLVSTYFRGQSGDTSALRSATTSLIMGLCCGCLLLTKQNVGVFYTLSVALFILLAHPKHADHRALGSLKSAFLLIASLTLGTLIPLAAVTMYMGSGWISAYISIDSKGSATTFLTRFFTDPGTRRLLGIAFAMAAICIVRAEHVSIAIRRFPCLGSYYEKGKSSVLLHAPVWLSAIDPTLIRVVLVTAVVIIARLEHVSIGLALPITGILVISAQAWLSEIEMAWWHRLSPILMGGLAYAGTMTASLNCVSLEVLAAVTFAAAWQFFSTRFVRISGWRFASLATAAMLACLWFKVSSSLYNWWGYVQGNISAAKYDLPFSELRGFKVDEQTRKLFDIISDYKDKLQPQDAIFAYPSVPIVYMLMNRLPPIRFPILWFDVASERNAPEIISDLEKTLPKYIFWLLPHRPVYEGHALLRKQTSLAFFIDRWILNKVASGKYVLDRNEPLAGSLDGPYELEDSAVARLLVTKELNCGQYIWLRPELTPDNKEAANSFCTQDSVLPIGKIAKLVFRNKYELLQAVSQDRIGIVLDNEFDRNQFLVLRRSDQ